MTLSKSKLPLLLLCLIVTLVTTSNLIWAYLNQVPPFYDTAGHTVLTYIYVQLFQGNLVADNLQKFFQFSPYYPPFMFIGSSFIPLLFGFTYKYLQYWAVIFISISTLFLYLYTKKLTKNSWWALFSASFFIFFPHIWEQSRYFMLDLPLTTFILISLYFLEKSQYLKKPLPTGLFFVFASFAQLTKWYAGIYLAIPFLFALYTSFKRSKISRKIWIQLGIYLGLASLFIFPWYAANFQRILNDLALFSKPDFGDPTHIFSLKNLTFYLILLINYQVVSIQFIWLIISLILWVKSKLASKSYFLLQIISIYGFFTLVGNKNLRYLMPLLPFLAIIMGYGLYKIYRQSRRLGIFLWTVFLILNLTLFSINSFGFPIVLSFQTTLKLHPKLDSIFLLDTSSKTIPYRFQKSSWSPQIIIDDLAKQTKNQKTLILVVANNPHVSVAGLEVFSLEKYLNLHFRRVPFDVNQSLQTDESIQGFLSKYNYLIVPNQYVAPQGQINSQNLEAIRTYILSGKTRDYALIKTYQLPNQDILYLLNKKPAYNTLSVTLKDDLFSLKRKPAVANIYFQFMNNDGQWFQENITQHQLEYEKNVGGIKVIRIDYPPQLWEIKIDENWQYDGDKQLNHL